MSAKSTKSQSISRIQSRFRGRPQWLLIRVDRMDQTTTTPLTGWLIAHDPNRDVIFRKSVGAKGLVLVQHSKEKLPEGYAVAF